MTTTEINNTISLVAEVIYDKIFGSIEEKRSLIEQEMERIPDEQVRRHVKIVLGI